MLKHKPLLMILLFPSGALAFLIILNIVMWGSYQLLDTITNDAETSSLLAAVLTGIVAVLLLIMITILAYRTSGSALSIYCWAALAGIGIYHFVSGLLWWFVYGLPSFSPDLYMGPVKIYTGDGSSINIIGLDLLALIITLLVGILTISVWAIFTRGKK